jgi:hypothetical protein
MRFPKDWDGARDELIDAETPMTATNEGGLRDAAVPFNY